jgi:hypothetical protein
MVFALGSEVIVISGDKTYEIINEGFADIPSPVPTPHVSTQATPAVSTPEQVHSETNPPKPSVVPTLPCMSGLVFALLPMIAVGAVRFRRK